VKESFSSPSLRRAPLHAAFVLLLICCCLVAGLGCNEKQKLRISFQTAAGEPVAAFHAEVAATKAAREIGLMYRKDLGDDEAMLFVFPAEGERSFWMKNTYIELDIIFVNAGKKIVSVVERAVPLTETARKSAAPAQYVVEIRGGKSKQLGLQPGMILHVEGPWPSAS
jgi:uncharacterized membrane protein (UPF0127 family)